jgi:hypothetical protein
VGETEEAVAVAGEEAAGRAAGEEAVVVVRDAIGREEERSGEDKGEGRRRSVCVFGSLACGGTTRESGREGSAEGSIYTTTWGVGRLGPTRCGWVDDGWAPGSRVGKSGAFRGRKSSSWLSGRGMICQSVKACCLIFFDASLVVKVVVLVRFFFLRATTYFINRKSSYETERQRQTRRK